MTTDVCFLIRGFSGGGAQRDAVLLANGLAGLGTAVRILVLDANGPLRAIVDARVKIQDLGQGRKLKMAFALPALRSAITDARPTVLVASEASGNALAVAATRFLSSARRPHLVLREVASPVQAKRTDPYVQNRLAYRLAPWLYPKADLVLALTEPVRHDLVQHFHVPEERVVVLGSNAVLTESRDTILNSLRRVAEPGLLVAVGRLSKEKGFDVLLSAVALVKKNNRVKLIIVGEGPARPDLETQIQRLGLGDTVQLVGFHNDPGAFLRRAEIFVSASRHEGLGNAIIEALAWGLPVVSTDAPYGPREILQNGRCGGLVPVDDPEALAKAITASFGRDHDERICRERATDFTVENAAKAFLGALNHQGISFH
jgi:glycosyltransferase involved in cell wall biosynthesis